MSITVISASFLGVVLVLLSISSQVMLWQRKEYRNDRMWAWFNGGEARLQFRGPLVIGLAGLPVGWVLYAFGLEKGTIIAGWISLITWGWHHLSRIYLKGVFRPEMTVKAMAIILVTLLFVVVLLISVGWQQLPALVWATVLLLLPVAVAASVQMVNMPFAWIKRFIIRRAINHRRQLKELSVVGVTGSYGKTSVKHFLSQILDDAGVINVSSAQHRNSELAVAVDMLHRLDDQTRVYVAEMGAYKSGEIIALVKLTKPKIGVVTAISNQHLALFGSRKKLAQTKWELVEKLPSEGVAILNYDDKVVRSRGQATKSIRVVWYSIRDRVDVWADEVEIEDRLIGAKIHIAGKKELVSIPLLGEGMLSNVLAAAAAAMELGVGAKDILASIGRLVGVARTMELRVGIRQAVVIDDSYSANEAGVLGAIAQVAKFTGYKKVVVLAPLIELGTDARRVHDKIGRSLNELGAKVLISGGVGGEHIVRKMVSGRAEVIKNPKRLAEVVLALMDANTVVLLEGRVPDVVRKLILN